MTSDQERAAPAQQPVAVSEAEIKAFRDKYRQMWPGSGLDRQSIVELLTASKEAVAAASEAFRSTFTALATTPSEPELRAEIVRLTRERDEHERMRTLYVTSAQEEHARAEAAESRVEALSAEVGKLTEALEATKTASHNHFMQAISNGEAAFDAKAKLAETRAAAFEEAAQIAEAERKQHDTGSGFDSQPAHAAAFRIREAIRSRAALDKGATA